MTRDQSEAIRELRDEGYVVVIFNPDELRGADPEHVQDRLVMLGWEAIDWFATEPSEDDE